MTSSMRKLDMPDIVVGREEEIDQFRQILSSIASSSSSSSSFNTTSTATTATTTYTNTTTATNTIINTTKNERRKRQRPNRKNAFLPPNKQSIYVSGTSGVGKSAFVKEALRVSQQNENRTAAAATTTAEAAAGLATFNYNQNTSISTGFAFGTAAASIIGNVSFSGDSVSSTSTHNNSNSKIATTQTPPPQPAFHYYFCNGKVDTLIHPHRPFAPIVDVLNCLCKQVRKRHMRDLSKIHKRVRDQIQPDDVQILKRLFQSFRLLLKKPINLSFTGTTTASTDEQLQVEKDDDVSSFSSSVISSTSGGVPTAVTMAPSAPNSGTATKRPTGPSSDTTSSSSAAPRPPPLGSAQSLTRFHGIKNGFSKLKTTIAQLINAIVTDENEIVVIFLDDLQHATVETMGMIERIIEFANVKLLFVGGYQTDSDAHFHPDHMLLPQYKQQQQQHQQQQQQQQQQHHQQFLRNSRAKQINRTESGGLLPMIPRNMASNRGGKNGYTGSSSIINHYPKTTIHLKPLKFTHIVFYLAQTLHRDEKDVMDLAKLIYEKTHGNMFLVKEYLELLYRNGHLYYSLTNFIWEWEDIPTIQDAVILDGNIESMVCRKILTLPKETIDVLKLASCLGNRFDLEVIQHIMTEWWKNRSNSGISSSSRSLYNNSHTSASTMGSEDGDTKPVEEILWDAVELDLLEELKASDPIGAAISYKFTHNKVQSAAYLLIGKAVKLYHLALGRYLRDLHRSEKGQSWMLISAADHLFKSEALVGAQEDRDEMALVCFLASRELRSISAFEAAKLVARNALFLLGENCWHRDYLLSLNIHELNAEMSFCSGDADGCKAHTRIILENAKSLDDKQNALVLHIENLGYSGQHQAAVQAGFQALRMLKMGQIPKRVMTTTMMPKFFATMCKLRRMSESDLSNRKTIEDSRVEFCGRVLVLSAIFACLCQMNDALAFLLIRHMRMSLKRGYTRTTPVAFMACAKFAAKAGRFAEAARLRKIALKVANRFDAPDVESITMCICHIAITPMFDQIGTKGQCLGEEFTKLMNIGINSGSVLSETLSSSAYMNFAFWEGSVRLDKLIIQSDKYCNSLSEGSNYHLPIIRAMRQMLLNMARPSNKPTLLQGDEIKNLESFLLGLDRFLLDATRFMSLHLCCFFCDWEQAEELALYSERRGSGSKPSYYATISEFWRALTWINLYERRASYKWKSRAVNSVKQLQSEVDKGLMNRSVFVFILQAELNGRVNQRPPEEVQLLYNQAIMEAEGTGWNHFAAFTNERAGDYFAGKARFTTAQIYFQRAIRGYTEWRAMGKVAHISSVYQGIMTNIPVDTRNLSMDISI